MLQNNMSMTQMMNSSQFTENNTKNMGQSNYAPMTIEKDMNPSTLGNTSIYVGKVKTESK